MGLFDRFKKNKEAEQTALQDKHMEPVLGFVLLNRPDHDWSSFISTMKQEWNLEITERSDEDNLVFTVGEMMVACAYMPTPIPNNEVEDCCKFNLLWPEAEQVVKLQQAHVIVTVMNATDAVAGHVLFTQVTSSLLQWEHAVAYYSAPMVVSASSYVEYAETIKERDLPVQLWVFTGLYTQEQKACAYTVGLNKFGKDEIEVLQSEHSLADVFGFMQSIISYVVEYDVILQGGQTIGFSADQKLQMTHSKGLSVPGDSIKIQF